MSQGNVPAGNTSNLSIGAARVYIGPVGATPTIDIGYLGEGGVTITGATENFDFKQGTPAVLIKRFVTDKTMEIGFDSSEPWNLEQLQKIVGGQYTAATTGVLESLDITVDPCTTELSLRIVHTMACEEDEAIYMDFYRVQASGGFELALASGQVHSIPASFAALASKTDWAGATFDDDRLCRITRVPDGLLP